MSTIYEELGIEVGEDYVPYVSLDPLNDPKSFTYRIKVIPRVTPLHNPIILSTTSRLTSVTSSFQVRDLGTPSMTLPEPTVATKKATFGMS